MSAPLNEDTIRDALRQVIDPELDWTCDVAALRSRSRNTPFSGRALRGKAALTVVGGRIAYSGER